MSGATWLTLGLGVVGLILGATLSVVHWQHRARMEAERAAQRFVPRVDARGVWLLLNGPMTVGLAAALLGAGAWRASEELEAARAARELDALLIGCEPGRVTIASRGAAPRIVSVLRARARHRARIVGPAIRLAAPPRFELAPGESRVLEASLERAGECGTEVLRGVEAQGPPEKRSVVAAVLEVAWLAGPTHGWPDCEGLAFTIVVRDAERELARGEYACGLARSPREPL